MRIIDRGGVKAHDVRKKGIAVLGKGQGRLFNVISHGISGDVFPLPYAWHVGVILLSMAVLL